MKEERLDKKSRSLGNKVLMTVAGAAVLAGVAAKPAEGGSGRSSEVSTMAQLDSEESKRAKWAKEVHEAQKRLQAPEILAARRGEGRDALGRLLSAATILAPYSMMPREALELHARYPIQIRFDQFGSIVMKSGIGTKKKEFLSQRYGNAALLGDDLLLTADHIYAVQRLGIEIQKPRILPDIALFRIPPPHATALKPTRQIVTLDPHISDADIDGKWASVVGIDPDNSADPATGRKTYQGFAFKVTDALASLLPNGNFDEETRNFYRSTFMMVLPEGEALGKTPPAMGMSASSAFCTMAGSPVFANGKFCGMFIASGSIWNSDTKQTINVGFLHGPDMMRKGIEKAKNNIHRVSVIY